MDIGDTSRYTRTLEKKQNKTKKILSILPKGQESLLNKLSGLPKDVRFFLFNGSFSSSGLSGNGYKSSCFVHEIV